MFYDFWDMRMTSLNLIIYPEIYHKRDIRGCLADI